MENFSQSDPFTTKDSIDVLESLKNNIHPDRPTVWLFKDTRMVANSIRVMYCTYKKQGLLPADMNLRICELKNPAGVLIFPK